MADMLLENYIRSHIIEDDKDGFIMVSGNTARHIADYIENSRQKVEVVRCKDCRNRKTPDCPMCEYIRLMRCEDTFTVNTCITTNTWRKIDHTTDDDFCSKGKRAEDPT